MDITVYLRICFLKVHSIVFVAFHTLLSRYFYGLQLLISTDCQVVNHSICPVWNEGFTWLFDIPPKGQKLYILCKSKNTFGKVWWSSFLVCYFFLVLVCNFLNSGACFAVNPWKSHHPDRQSRHGGSIQRVLQPQPRRRQGWLENARDRDCMVKQTVQQQYVAWLISPGANIIAPAPM